MTQVPARRSLKQRQINKSNYKTQETDSRIRDVLLQIWSKLVSSAVVQN